MPMCQKRWRCSAAVAAVIAAIQILPLQAQTTQPSLDQPASTQPAAADETPRRSTYDFWKTKKLTGDWDGARTALEEAGLSFNLSYQQQYQQNFRGGLDTHNGHRFSGTYDMVLEADFEKMKLIPGGSFYIKAKGGYSDGINPDKVGSLYNVNSDAFEDYSIFVRKWWYKQEFFDGKLEIRLGRIQSNKDLFDTGLYAYHEDRDFLNQMSIRNVLIPHRTDIGVFARVEPVKDIYFQTAALDAQSSKRTGTGFDTAFHEEAWFVGLWELGATPKWKTEKGPMPGYYRVGWWYDPRVRKVFERTLQRNSDPEMRGGDVGFYLGADQMVWKENKNPKDLQGLGLFSRFGAAHGDINKANFYWSAGASYKGLIPTRDNDVTGFEVAQAILSEQYRDEVNSRADRETVYEWYYAYHLTPWCIISPDFQVVTNPGGDKDDRDAIIGGVRIQIIF